MSLAPTDSFLQHMLRIGADAAAVVFQFLSASALGSLMLSCKSCADLILMMRCLQLRLKVEVCPYDAAERNSTVRALCLSPLARRHLTALDVLCDGQLWSATRNNDASFLDEFAIHLPQLREFKVWARTLPERRWHFPTALRKLTIRGICHEPQSKSNIITAIAQQLPLLEDLSIELNLKTAAYDLAPLIALPRLTRLAHDGSCSVSVAAVIRRLPALRLLHLYHFDFNSAFLPRLTARPHALRLEEVSGLFGWTEAMADAMSSVPTLTTADLGIFEGSSMQFLRSLPLLSTLHVSVSRLSRSPAPISQQPQLIVDGVRGCAQLTCLHISNGTLNCDQWSAILQSLPLLSRLQIVDPVGLESLRCFADAAPTLSRSLTWLRLFMLRHASLTTADFEHLRGLARLEFLALPCIRTGLLDAPTRAALTPPSIWLPKLQQLIIEKEETVRL